MNDSDSYQVILSQSKLILHYRSGWRACLNVHKTWNPKPRGIFVALGKLIILFSLFINPQVVLIHRTTDILFLVVYLIHKFFYSEISQKLHHIRPKLLPEPEGIPFTVVRTLNAKTNPIFLRTNNMYPLQFLKKDRPGKSGSSICNLFSTRFDYLNRSLLRPRWE